MVDKICCVWVDDEGQKGLSSGNLWGLSVLSGTTASAKICNWEGVWHVPSEEGKREDVEQWKEEG